VAEKTDAFAALVARLGRFIFAVGAPAAIGVLVRWGWRGALAFSFGVVAAFFNMRWLAGALERPTAPRTAILALRFGLIGAVAYVILETFEISPLFVLAGLLTASLAVILEILFQLFYART
jgi:ATP synthase I chain